MASTVFDEDRTSRLPESFGMRQNPLFECARLFSGDVLLAFSDMRQTDIFSLNICYEHEFPLYFFALSIYP